MLHHFTRSIAHIALPDKFTYPFHYTPHPLCVMAADEVQVYLQHQAQWQDELQQGKMFGVLIVQTTEGEIGYLAAFSGILAGKNIHPYFVPPIYDLLQPDGFFKKEEEHISAINHRIRELEEDTSYQKCRQALEEETARCSQLLSQAKAKLKAAKELRDCRRQTEQLSESEQAAMIRESQFQKAELKRLERSLKEHLSSLQKETDTYVSQIEALKNERKSRSTTLQQQLFEQFRLLNARGEVKDLCSIFAHTVHKIPPAGAGECAAPKLLQYAYFHHYRPVAMAEFWWGDSPKAEIRHHGHYYPACKGKCEPILGHMLQGLEVEENPLLEDNHRTTVLDIIYEDDYLLIVNKPAGMLSVPGKETADSVYSRIRHLYPDATGPLVVHRLDMATSGLLLIAKTKEVHQNLQAQFSNRSIKKRYTALLEGIVSDEEGTIDLPLCLNPLDRPRQIVDKEHGKPAITRYRVLARTKSQTLVAFYPLTGRTHQLRVHSAHSLGLHCPIKGDELYGSKADRLYLHAESLEFTHPVSKEKVTIEVKADFTQQWLPQPKAEQSV
ncbi:RluA family pseudouridine synthase [Phocaeicola massiliensis]|uniref:RluA family pseudouridine synthase n=1 Tax=Phocaeicola massiliensis TaxID=204516 RepID=UPI002030C5B9|nr:RluA family pseudouridine synthase [Phocaeicola massiliensis]MCM1615407.1 pseudouridine synthase [Phocaeicola massiliensis]MCM1707301.1 pseudouridine synthase [Phocaeicola massiliensis]